MSCTPEMLHACARIGLHTQNCHACIEYDRLMFRTRCEKIFKKREERAFMYVRFGRR